MWFLLFTFCFVFYLPILNSADAYSIKKKLIITATIVILNWRKFFDTNLWAVFMSGPRSNQPNRQRSLAVYTISFHIFNGVASLSLLPCFISLIHIHSFFLQSHWTTMNARIISRIWQNSIPPLPKKVRLRFLVVNINLKLVHRLNTQMKS